MNQTFRKILDYENVKANHTVSSNKCFQSNSHSRQDCVAVAALATPGVPTGKLLYTSSHTPMSCLYDMSEGQVFLNKAQNI